MTHGKKYLLRKLYYTTQNIMPSYWKPSVIRGLWKKKKYSEKNSVDTLADAATVRSSHRWCSVTKDVLRNLANIAEKHLC